ncbi:MAG: diheme cytochrome c-553 [Bacteroidota bacterium]
MRQTLYSTALVLTLAAGTLFFFSFSQAESGKAKGASKEQIERGRYLVMIGGCQDCHTPKTMGPQGPVFHPMKTLSGHRADAQLPDVPDGVIAPDKWGALTNHDLTAWVGLWGTSFSSNLTPDEATGIGAWTEEQWLQTFHTGKHLGTGRPILPPMPIREIARMEEEDLKAIFAYLMSIKPIRNAVPQPIPPPGHGK